MTGTDRSTEALLARRAIAEQATTGPWFLEYGAEIPTGVLSEIGYVSSNVSYEDAAHIAANSPDVVIADIDEILRLRAEFEQLEEEADWLANRLNNTFINQCCFCRDGIKQHTVKCQCTKTWRDIARKAVKRVEDQKCSKN